MGNGTIIAIVCCVGIIILALIGGMMSDNTTSDSSYIDSDDDSSIDHEDSSSDVKKVYDDGDIEAYADENGAVAIDRDSGEYSYRGKDGSHISGNLYE